MIVLYQRILLRQKGPRVHTSVLSRVLLIACQNLAAPGTNGRTLRRTAELKMMSMRQDP